MKQKKRNTISKIIEKDPDIGKTDFAALYGRRLSKMEGYCHVFLSSFHDLRVDDDGSKENAELLKLPGTDRDISKRILQESKFFLATEILNAILKRDILALKTLASFVKKWEYLKEPEDVERFQILLLKKRCELAGTKMLVADVAENLNRNYKKNYDTKNPEQLSALRKRLKRLGFPLAIGKKGRRNRGQIRNKIASESV